MNEKICEKIGKKIKKIRESKKLSLEYVSGEAHISISTLVRYEDGESQKIDNLTKISHVLGVNVLDLIDENIEEPNSEYNYIKHTFGDQLCFALTTFLASGFIEWNRYNGEIIINSKGLPMIDFLDDMFNYAKTCKLICYDDQKKDFIDEYYIILRKIIGKHIEIFNSMNDNIGK